MMLHMHPVPCRLARLWTVVVLMMVALPYAHATACGAIEAGHPPMHVACWSTLRTPHGCGQMACCSPRVAPTTAAPLSPHDHAQVQRRTGEPHVDPLSVAFPPRPHPPKA